MKKRDSRFELLRIISMFLIIIYHYGLYGNWNNSGLKIQVFSPWGQIGVSLFLLISGYFLSARDYSLKKAWFRNKKLWIKVIFYSWLLLLLCLIFNWGIFPKREYGYAVFPVIFNEYWFITSYIILIFLTPILNPIINNKSEKNIILYIFFFMIVGDIMPIIKNNGLPDIFNVGVMIPPYLIAGYLKKYKKIPKISTGIILVIIGISAEYLSLVMLQHPHLGFRTDNFTFGIFPLISAVGLFSIFLNFPSFHSSAINWIASGVLASYLITEHPLFRMYFWQKLLDVGRFQDPTWKFILMGLLIAIVTVFVCSLIDKVYEFIRRLFKRVHTSY